MFRFLRTRIGLSLLIALIIIVVSVSFKFTKKDPAPLGPQIDLIADTSLKKAIESGALETPEWEKLLLELSGTTTIDDKIVELQTQSTTTETLTATDLFARTFLIKYVNLRKSGTPLDETTATNLINSLLAQDFGSALPEKTYTESDITVTSSGSLRTYGNSIGSILQAPIPKGYEQELEIITRVTNTENTEDLEKLKLNIERYEGVLAELIDLPVPKALKEAHLTLINSVNSILEGVQGMLLIEQDPVGATKMISRYEDGIKSLDFPLLQIRNYLISQKVTFSPSESGYWLLR